MFYKPKPPCFSMAQSKQYSWRAKPNTPNLLRLQLFHLYFSYLLDNTYLSPAKQNTALVKMCLYLVAKLHELKSTFIS